MCSFQVTQYQHKRLTSTTINSIYCNLLILLMPTAHPSPGPNCTGAHVVDEWQKSSLKLTAAQKTAVHLYSVLPSSCCSHHVSNNGTSQIRPQSTPFRGPISKPHYLPHRRTRTTYDAKRHLDPICRFSTMRWTDRPMHVRTDAQTDRSSTGKFDHYRHCATRAMQPNNNNNNNTSSYGNHNSKQDKMSQQNGYTRNIIARLGVQSSAESILPY